MNIKLAVATAFAALIVLNIYTLNKIPELKAELQVARVDVINIYDSLGYYAEGRVLNIGPDTISGAIKEIDRKLSNLCQKNGCN